jgi:hypothetical protein
MLHTTKYWSQTPSHTQIQLVKTKQHHTSHSGTRLKLTELTIGVLLLTCFVTLEERDLSTIKNRWNKQVEDSDPAFPATYKSDHYIIILYLNLI